jgi:hypothetical protein
MRKTQRSLLSVLALIIWAANASAWDDTGHIVVAQIAWENLDSLTKTRVRKLAQRVFLAEKTYDFVTVACWMDDARDFPMFEPLREWHFINKRFIVSGPALDAPPPLVNVQMIIEWCVQKLGDRTSKENVKAYALAYLVHLVGDAHQPLHCATRYTEKHKDGDAGGNFFLLANAPKDNLHSYWDAAGGLFNFVRVIRPLDSAGKQAIKQWAKKIMAAHPANSLPALNDLQAGAWVEESHQLARSEVYQNIEENGTPNSAYAAKTKSICGQRIAMAGYRLAALLNNLFGQP